jgi:molybdopterin-guanine dinucleotide biosynthesis protein A
MGHFPKGLLRRPGGETLVEHAASLLGSLGLDVVLVGDLDVYGFIGREIVADACPGVGPLGGLVAALRRARGGSVLALACDLPDLSLAPLRRLLDAPLAPATCFAQGGFLEPLCARYDSSLALPVATARLAAGELSLQGLLRQLGARFIEARGEEIQALADRDEPLTD